jgi:hypothetical protein
MPTRLFAYLPSYLPTNLVMKKIEVQILLCTLTKKFMKVQGNMLNVFGIIFFTKWWVGLMAKTMVCNQGNQGSIMFTNIYYVEYVYS